MLTYHVHKTNAKNLCSKLPALKILDLDHRLSNVYRLNSMEAEKCNLPHDTHFRLRRPSSACGRTFSACGEPAPHAGERSPRAETNLRMWRYLLGVRRPCSTCGDSVLTCGDLFFFQTITPKSFHYSTSVNSNVNLGVLNLLRSLFSRHCDFYKAVTEERPGVKGVASENRPGAP